MLWLPARLTVLGLLMVVLPASAASPFGGRPTEIDLQNTYHPPKLFVAETRIARESDQAVSGSFVLHHTEKYPLNALYRFEVFGPVPENTRRQYGLSEDTAILHYRSPAITVETLAAGEKRSVPFHFTLPPLPAGRYTLRLQSLTATGRHLGWGDVPLQKTGGDERFAYVYSGKITIPEYKESLGSLTGPNVSPGASFTLQGTAENTSHQSLQITPRLTIYRFDPARARHDTILLPSLTLKPRQSRPLAIPVKAATEPGVYFAELTLLDEQRIARSTVAEYRWVVRGVGADVIVAAPLRFDRGRKQTIIRLEFVGPADAETKLDQASLRLTLEDQRGVIGTQTISDLSLNDAIQGGQATVALTRVPEGFLRLTAAVQDQNNATVSQRAETFAVLRLPGQSRWALSRLAILAVGLGLLALVYLLSRFWLRHRG